MELTATVKHPEISQVNGAEAAVTKTHLRQQSSCHKAMASYEAALAKANAVSTIPVCNTASVGRKASALVKRFEDTVKSTRTSVKNGAPVVTSQKFTAELSTALGSYPNLSSSVSCCQLPCPAQLIFEA